MAVREKTEPGACNTSGHGDGAPESAPLNRNRPANNRDSEYPKPAA